MPTTEQRVDGVRHGSGDQHAALCSAVALSVALAVVHVGSISHGGMHVTMRHTMRPIVATSWWHWPYRNCTHPVRQLPQSPFAHPQSVVSQAGEQNAPPPHVQVALQSM